MRRVSLPAGIVSIFMLFFAGGVATLIHTVVPGGHMSRGSAMIMC